MTVALVGILDGSAVCVIHFVNSFVWILIFIVLLPSFARNVAGTWLATAVVSLLRHDLVDMLAFVAFLGSERAQMSFLFRNCRFGFVGVYGVSLLSDACGLNRRKLFLLFVALNCVTDLIVLQILFVQILIGTLWEIAALQRLQGLIVF